MKLFKLSVLALALAGVFTACSEDNEYVPGAQSPGAYFPANNKTSINLDKNAASFEVSIARTDASQAVSYTLTSEADATIFTIPNKVDFAAGADATTITISYDAEKMVYDKPYKISISLPEAEASEYGAATYNFTVVIASPWKSLGKAQYTEDLFTTFFNIDNITYAVEIQENEENPGIYRLVSPYGAAYPYNEAGDYVEEPRYMVINAQNPNQVYIEKFYSGCDWSYGEIVITSLAYLHLQAGATPEEVAAAGEFGQLKDGIITFPAKSLLIAMLDYNDAGLYYSNNNGMFCVVMPGAAKKDYETSVSFMGTFTNADATQSTAIAQFTIGSNVTGAKAAIMAGASAAQVEAAIISGDVETIDLSAGSNQTRGFPIEGAGKYTIGVVAYDGNEQVNFASTSFTISTGVAEDDSKDWTSIGFADYVDGWILPALQVGGVQINPFEWQYTVEVQQKKNEDGVYRLVNPYGEDFPGSELNTNTKAANIVINVLAPNFVYVEPQYSGFSFDEEEPVTVGNVEGMYIGDYEPATIIAAELNTSKFEDGVIYITDPVFGCPGVGDGSFGYQWEGGYPTVIQLPDGAEQVKAKKAAAKAPKAVRASKKAQKANTYTRQAIKSAENANARISK